MMRYTDAGNLLIVGNRTNAQTQALQRGAAVLITGGFDTEESVKRLADELALPFISQTPLTITIGIIFIIIGGLSIYTGVKAYRFYLPHVLKEREPL